MIQDITVSAAPEPAVEVKRRHPLEEYEEDTSSTKVSKGSSREVHQTK